MMPNRCVEYVLENALLLDPVKDPDGDVVSDGLTLTKHESEIVTQTLDSLLHLTTYKDFCEKFLESRGLEILVEIEKFDKTDINMRLTLCRIVANISEHDDFAYHFFVTGWVGLLAKWACDEDMRIQVTALLALANLDKDDNFPVTYPSKVYPLHPKQERKTQPNVDVIFVHGLLGGVFITWRQKKTMAPEVSSITNTKSNAVLPKVTKKSLHFPDFFKKKKEIVVQKKKETKPVNNSITPTTQNEVYPEGKNIIIAFLIPLNYLN